MAAPCSERLLGGLVFRPERESVEVSSFAEIGGETTPEEIGDDLVVKVVRGTGVAAAGIRCESGG